MNTITRTFILALALYPVTVSAGQFVGGSDSIAYVNGDGQLWVYTSTSQFARGRFVKYSIRSDV